MSPINIPGVRSLKKLGNHFSSYIRPPPPCENSDITPKRKILVVHAHPVPKSFSSAIADAFVQSSKSAGHEVQRISLSDQYQSSMSRKERVAYFELLDSPDRKEKALSRDVKAHINMLRWCDTLVFIYPTWWMNTPATLKGWLDRTLVPKSTWDSPDLENKGALLGLVPKLNNIERIIGISTYGATQTQVTLAGDNGRRMIANPIRHVICPQATVLWLGLYNMDFISSKDREDFLEEVRRLPKDI